MLLRNKLGPEIESNRRLTFDWVVRGFFSEEEI